MTTYAREYKLKPSGAVAPAAAVKSSAVVYPDTRNQKLVKSEIIELGIASNHAFQKYAEASEADGYPVKDMARDHGVSVSAVQKDWRHGQVKVATDGRADGLTKLMRADYRTVLAHFLHLAGLTEAAFRALLRTGDRADRDGASEPVENGEQSAHAVAAVMRKVEAHFEQQGPGAPERAAAFFQKLIAWKERKAACGWRSWDSKAQWHLYFTIKNRLAAMEGKGCTANRNKSQRNRWACPSTEPSPAEAQRALF